MAQIFADKTTESAAIGEICGGKKRRFGWCVVPAVAIFQTLWSVAGIALKL
jgi:hypothetical protein